MKKKAVRVILGVAAAAAAALGLIVVGTLRDWPWVHAGWRWLDAFARTPGFGALAAVVAATIAYRAATVRIRHDRDADKARRDAEVVAAGAQRRWEMLMWAYQNASTTDPARLARVCNELEEELATSLEKGLLAVIVSDVTQPDSSPETSTAGAEAVEDGDAELLGLPLGSEAEYAFTGSRRLLYIQAKQRWAEMSPETRTTFDDLLKRLDEQNRNLDRLRRLDEQVRDKDQNRDKET